jgi:hypothetical protein
MVVAKSMERLTNEDLKYLEVLLGREFATESDRCKSWQQKNKYDKPFGKQNQILNCLNAIRDCRRVKEMLDAKW